MELYSPNNTDIMKTMFSLNFREDVFDLDEFSCDSFVTSTDIRVFKLLYHPRGSNIFYSLSREYIYQQNQKNYFNNQLLFTSFRSIDEAYRFIRRNCLCLYFSTKGYEELLIVNCIIPSGSLYFEYTSNGIYGNYYNSNSIILRETDIDNIEKYNYFC